LKSWWTDERPGLRIENYGQLALDRIPSTNAVASAEANGTAADAWADVRTAVDDGVAFAMKALRSAGIAA
jgi:hypothetical protein